MRSPRAVRSASRAALLAAAVTAALPGAALATVGTLTLNSSAPLSPGRLHATLTGTISCDPGEWQYLNALIVQRRTHGVGSTVVTCDGTVQSYAIDVSTASTYPAPSGAFKPGEASAQVSTTVCDPGLPMCTLRYVDAIIELTEPAGS